MNNHIDNLIAQLSAFLGGTVAMFLQAATAAPFVEQLFKAGLLAFVSALAGLSGKHAFTKLKDYLYKRKTLKKTKK